MKYDRKIVVDNILRLMKENNITQNSLAEITESHQGRISKCLRCEGDFTLPQLFSIAEHFHITLDDLVGRKEEILHNGITLKDLGEIINQIANIKGVKFVEVPGDKNITATYDSLMYHRKNYSAFYFDNVLEDFPLTYNIGNVQMNDFIEKMINLLKLKSSGELSQEDYDYLINKHLEKLPSETVEQLIEDSMCPLPFN